MAHMFFKLDPLATGLSGTCIDCSDLDHTIGFIEQLKQLKAKLTRMVKDVAPEAPALMSVQSKTTICAPQDPETPRHNKQDLVQSWDHHPRRF